jgi:hypothetical protein
MRYKLILSSAAQGTTEFVVADGCAAEGIARKKPTAQIRREIG